MSLFRGSSIQETDFKYLDEGFYGVVFKSEATNKVLKLYIAGKTCSRCGHEEALVEIKAIQIANNLEELAPYLMNPTVTYENFTIIDANNLDITDKFLPEIGVYGDFISEPLIKISSAATTAAERQRIVQAFRENGIHYMIDASVAVDQNGQITKVIDFGLFDHGANCLL